MKKGVPVTQFVREMNEKANALAITRKNIAELEERNKRDLEPLKAIEAKLKEALINSLNHVGLKSVTAQNGESYHITTTYEFEFVNDAEGLHELQYARDNNLLRPDRIALRQSLREKFEKEQLPKGIAAYEKHTIAVKKPKE